MNNKKLFNFMDFMRLLPFVASAMLVACSSVADLRNQPADVLLTSKKSPKQFAICFGDLIVNDGKLPFATREINSGIQLVNVIDNKVYHVVDITKGDDMTDTMIKAHFSSWGAIVNSRYRDFLHDCK